VAYIGILHSPLAAQSIPAKLVECEANRCDGAWTFRGQEGNAQWDGGIRATLKVERYDADRILIRRTDTAGPTPGLTALYEGMMRGDRIEGDVTWSWPGHWDKPVTGRWSATIDTKPAQTGETGHPPVAPTDQRAPVSGQIVATLTGTIGVLHDNLGVFGGGSYFGKSAGATRLGPPVRLVFT
jgi:hypothetical protein